jgi:RecJ-like exonuclease
MPDLHELHAHLKQLEEDAERDADDFRRRRKALQEILCKTCGGSGRVRVEPDDSDTCQKCGGDGVRKYRWPKGQK